MSNLKNNCQFFHYSLLIGVLTFCFNSYGQESETELPGLDNPVYYSATDSIVADLPNQIVRLYGEAHVTYDDVVLDAYSGIGTIGMIASKRGISKVYSVELNKISSIMAKSNARINNIDNIEIINADATKYILKLADQKVKVDVVILDPTRSGTTVEFIQAVAKLKPKQVIYVSCNPETQLRDLKYFEKNYKVKTIVGVDLFPFTKHVETVVLMSRK